MPPPALPLLTTLCAAKTYIGIAVEDTTQDAVIRQLIPGISNAIRKYTGRDFGGLLEYTEYYSGDGTPRISLRQRPVLRDGLRVWVDYQAAWGQSTDSFTSETELEPGTFALEEDSPGYSASGMLYRINGVWPMCAVRLWQNQSPDLAADHTYPSGNVKVVFTAGQEPPENVKLAANAAISHVMQIRQHGGMVQSESYSDYAYTLAGKSGSYENILGRYAMSLLATDREMWW